MYGFSDVGACMTPLTNELINITLYSYRIEHMIDYSDVVSFFTRSTNVQFELVDGP